MRYAHFFLLSGVDLVEDKRNGQSQASQILI